MQASKHPDTDQWHKLFDLATKFRKVKPWDLFSDSDFFAIRRPSNGEAVFPLIMGNGGHFFGLSIYIGETGLLHYSMAQANFDTFHPVFVSMYSNILLSFMDRKFLSKDDLKLPGSMGMTFKGKNAWPQFRKMSCMHLDSQINREEADLLIEIIPLIIDIVSLAREQPQLMSVFDESPLPLFEKTSQSTWVTTEMGNLPNVMDALKPENMIRDGDIKRFKYLDRKNAVWQLGWKVAPGGIGEDSDELSSFTIVHLVDKKIPKILQFSLLTPSKREDLWSDLWNEFMKMLNKEKFYPSEMEVSDPWLLELLKPLEEHLDIRVVLRETMPEMDDAFDFVFDAMEKGQF